MNDNEPRVSGEYEFYKAVGEYRRRREEDESLALARGVMVAFPLAVFVLVVGALLMDLVLR